MKPCRLQCEQIYNICYRNGFHEIKLIDCNQYQNNNCMINIPEGYFLLNPDLVSDSYH